MAFDGYKALFDMAHYYLKGDGPILQYIDIEGGTQNVDAKAGMKFKFAGSVPKEEIQKITVTNSVTGDRAAGNVDRILRKYGVGFSAAQFKGWVRVCD